METLWKWDVVVDLFDTMGRFGNNGFSVQWFRKDKLISHGNQTPIEDNTLENTFNLVH